MFYFNVCVSLSRPLLLSPVDHEADGFERDQELDGCLQDTTEAGALKDLLWVHSSCRWRNTFIGYILRILRNHEVILANQVREQHTCQ